MEQVVCSTHSRGLFSLWREAVTEVWFKTRSPFPDMDYYYSSEPLPQCSNSSSQITDISNTEKIKQYFLEQIAILLYNNKGFTKEQIETVISVRLIHWKGNLKIRDCYRELNLGEIIDEVLSMEDYTSLINFKKSHHWYGDEIEKLPVNQPGSEWGKRTKAKQRARTDFNANAIREDVEQESDFYRENNHNVFPTKQDLIKATGYSDYQIRTYGKDYYISKKENTKQLIANYYRFYPGATQKELAELTGLKLRTIARYSKGVQ